jgi:RNA:NAD 2'-phosphotransferase (TPT1/KptA family)
MSRIGDPEAVKMTGKYRGDHWVAIEIASHELRHSGVDLKDILQ